MNFSRLSVPEPGILLRADLPAMPCLEPVHDECWSEIYDRYSEGRLRDFSARHECPLSKTRYVALGHGAAGPTSMPPVIRKKLARAGHRKSRSKADVQILCVYAYVK